MGNGTGTGDGRAGESARPPPRTPRPAGSSARFTPTRCTATALSLRRSSMQRFARSAIRLRRDHRSQQHDPSLRARCLSTAAARGRSGSSARRSRRRAATPASGASTATTGSTSASVPAIRGSPTSSTAARRPRRAVLDQSSGVGRASAAAGSTTFVDGIDAASRISNGRTARSTRRWPFGTGCSRGTPHHGVGSSDWHREPNPIDDANVRVSAPGPDETAILDGDSRRPRDRHERRPCTHARHHRPRRRPTARVGDRSAIGAGAAPRHRRAAPATCAAAVVVDRHERPRQRSRDALDASGARAAALPAVARLCALSSYRAADGSLLAITNPVYLVRPVTRRPRV